VTSVGFDCCRLDVLLAPLPVLLPLLQPLMLLRPPLCSWYVSLDLQTLLLLLARAFWLSTSLLCCPWLLALAFAPLEVAVPPPPAALPLAPPSELVPASLSPIV
jgi:hypothetical protein